MKFFVYLLININKNRATSYVGYTNNLKLRLNKHNANLGAKSTRGYKWTIIYSKKFSSKNEAMSYEYKLKNDKKLRKELLKKTLK